LCLAAIAKEINALDRCERSAGTEVEVRHRTVVEVNGNEPWVIRAAQPELLYGQ